MNGSTNLHGLHHRQEPVLSAIHAVTLARLQVVAGAPRDAGPHDYARAARNAAACLRRAAHHLDASGKSPLQMTGLILSAAKDLSDLARALRRDTDDEREWPSAQPARTFIWFPTLTLLLECTAQDGALAQIRTGLILARAWALLAPMDRASSLAELLRQRAARRSRQQQAQPWLAPAWLAPA